MTIYYDIDEWEMWPIGKRLQMCFFVVAALVFLVPACILLWHQRKSYLFVARPLFIEYLKLGASFTYMVGLQVASPMLAKTIRVYPAGLAFVSVVISMTYSSLVCLYVFATGYRCFFQIQLQSEKTRHRLNAESQESSVESGSNTARNSSWYLRRRKRFTTRFFVLVGYAHAAGLSSLYALIYFAFPSKVDSLFYPILMAFLGAHTVILVYLFRKKSRSERDGLEVVRELKYVALVWWLCAVIWLGATLIPLGPDGYPPLATYIMTPLMVSFGHCGSFWLGLGFTVLRVQRRNRAATEMHMRLLNEEGEINPRSILEHVLSDEGATMRQSLMAFLESEWAAESLLFLVAISDLQKNVLQTAAEYRTAVRKINSSFLVDSAPLLLNLPAPLHKGLNARVAIVLADEEGEMTETAREDLFDSVRDYIFRCLTMDNVPRFIDREKREGQQTARAGLETVLSKQAPKSKAAWSQSGE